MSENEDENEYDVESEEEEVINRNEVKLNNFRRAKRNWRKCLGCNENENLHRPTKKMRLAICKAQKIYIQANDRVCDYHLQESNPIEHCLKFQWKSSRGDDSISFG